MVEYYSRFRAQTAMAQLLVLSALMIYLWFKVAFENCCDFAESLVKTKENFEKIKKFLAEIILNRQRGKVKIGKVGMQGDDKNRGNVVSVQFFDEGQFLQSKISMEEM
jgi:hypothetical protein